VNVPFCMCRSGGSECPNLCMYVCQVEANVPVCMYMYMSDWSECPNSSPTADVFIHRFPSVVSRRGQLLRSSGLQFLHADEDRVPAVALRGRGFHRVGYHNTGSPINPTLFSVDTSPFQPLARRTSRITEKQTLNTS